MAKKPASTSKPKYLDRGVPTSEPTPKWSETVGKYASGREAIDAADHLAVEMDRLWGVGRLRLLVDGELRNKHDRQRYLFLQAQAVGDLEDVKRESSRMVAAYRALDKAAKAVGALPVDDSTWECGIDTGIFKGVVVAIVKHPEAVAKVRAEGRHLIVYTLDEICRMIAADHFTLSVKEHFPGAEVIPAKQVKDPIRPSLLDGEPGIIDISAPIDGIKDFDFDVGDPVPF